MEKEKRSWHQVVMVCPACGTDFRPEVLGFHVRLCPDCEEKALGRHRPEEPPLVCGDGMSASHSGVV